MLFNFLEYFRIFSNTFESLGLHICNIQRNILLTNIVMSIEKARIEHELRSFMQSQDLVSKSKYLLMF